MLDIEYYNTIHEILKNYCIPKSLLGYEYLITGIKILSENNNIPIVELYTQIAECHNSEKSRVERAIRHAIERGYDNCIDYKIDSFKNICLTGGRPTNSEFIKSIVFDLKYTKAY